jgi:hypothetical protein
MRKRLTAVILSSGAAALAIGLGATTAMASSATTFSVSPGGAFSFAGTGQVKDATNSSHVVAKCTITMSGTLKKGHGLAGKGIGTITKGSFTKCTIATLSVTVTTNGLPWKMNATSYNSTTGVTTGTISGLDLVANGPGCTATLDGTAAGANNGTVKITYTNSTGKIKLLGTGGNLHSYAVNGCFGLINNGDVEQASGSGAVTPKQTITSP